MEAKISVVIPTYNREKTILRCIFSVLNQTKPPFEVIVIDDGSTDKTVDLVKSVDNKLIRIIKQNHKGAQAARNRGILNVRGNYIAFLDSDDEWLPDCIETYLKCLNEGNKSKILWADCYVFNEEANEKRIWHLPGKSGNVYKHLLAQAGPMFQGMLVPRDALLRAGLLDENVSAFQEWDTAIALSKKNEFKHIKCPLFIYHVYEGKTISKDKKAGMDGYSYIVAKYKDDIIEKNGYKCLCKHYRVLLGECKYLENFEKIKMIIKYSSLLLFTFFQDINANKRGIK